MINGRWKHPNIVRSRIEKDIKPHLGKRALDAVEPRQLDAMLRAVVRRGAPTIANDLLRWVRRMFDYAIKRHLVRFNRPQPSTWRTQAARNWLGSAPCRTRNW
jgi:hypothetical protein